MRVARSVLALFVLFFFLVASFCPLCSSIQQVVEEKETGSIQIEEESERIVGSPQNIKEKTGIFVFVGWMWLSVIVLVSFLRLKIKEADRPHRLNFFLEKKE